MQRLQLTSRCLFPFLSTQTRRATPSLLSFRAFCTTGKAEECVALEKKDKAVALITLTRPKALNAVSETLRKQLMEKLRECDADDDVRAIVLTGSGPKAFAAGADIKEMSSRTTFGSVAKDDMLGGWEDIRRIKKPIIAAVNGFALGGGCEVAMMCDIIIASVKAKFGQPEIKLGTIPGMGGTQRLTHAVGKSKAMEWMLTGDFFSAEEAQKAGLISRVVEGEQLLPEALILAEKIAAMPQMAVLAAKECVNRAFEASLAEGLLFERRLFHTTWATNDRAEGMAAFLEKRDAKFTHT